MNDINIRCTNKLNLETSKLSIVKKLYLEFFDTTDSEDKKEVYIQEGELYSFLIRNVNGNLDISNEVVRGRLVSIEEPPKTRTFDESSAEYLSKIKIRIDCSTALNSDIRTVQLKHLVDVNSIDHVYSEVPTKSRPIPEDWVDKNNKVAKMSTEELPMNSITVSIPDLDPVFLRIGYIVLAEYAFCNHNKEKIKASIKGQLAKIFKTSDEHIHLLISNTDYKSSEKYNVCIDVKDIEYIEVLYK